jgi:hypothetical protein
MTEPVSSEAEVHAYLRDEHPRVYELAVWARARALDAEPDFTERVYRGWRGIGFRHAEAGYVCALYPKEDRVDLLFEHGASLLDPDGLLEGEGTQTRVLRVTSADERTARAIDVLVQQAVAQRLLTR